MAGPVETRILELVELDSGARVGLDAKGRFAITHPEELWVFAPEHGHMFHEVLEWSRNKFDDALEQGAKLHGLPPLEVSLSFPAAEIVRAVLIKNMHYTTRLALQWLRPSEIRDVQVEIRRITEDRKIPTVLRDFAARLLLPD